MPSVFRASSEEIHEHYLFVTRIRLGLLVASLVCIAMPAQKQTRKEVVLLADSDADTRTMYSEFLRFHGYRVVSVLTAREALVLAPRVDVVVTESRLPGGVNGLEMVTRLKASEDTARIPVAVVTSSAWNTDRDRAERAGCDLFLSKPCLPSELLRAVRRLLAAAKRHRADRQRSHLVPPRFALAGVGAGVLVEDA